LQTDHVELLQLHGIGDHATLQAALQPDGAVPAMQAAQAAGHVQHLGITSHDPAFLCTVIDEGLFDVVLTPFNVLYQDAAHQLFRRARDRDIGVVIMKPFASGALTTPTPRTQQLFQDTPSSDRAAAALRFILPQDIATIGVHRVQRADRSLLLSRRPGHPVCRMRALSRGHSPAAALWTISSSLPAH
jgi:predicted aldo/keto reductase-like oxidoreductase